MKAAALIALALAALPAPAFAETSLTAYEAARQALLSIWAELPLTARNVTLVEGTPTGFGSYVVHDGNSYEPGEEIHVYAEMLGYGWRDNGDGTFSRLLDADLSLIDASGTTVASKEKFVSTEQRAREKSLDCDLTFNVTLSAFAPGAYTLRFTVHDRAAGKDATFDVPVTLAADSSTEPSSSEASSEPLQ